MISLVKMKEDIDLSPYSSFLNNLRSDHTKEAYRQDLKQLLRFLEIHCRGMGVEEAEEDHLVSFITSFKVIGAKDRTVNRKISFLKKFYRWLVRHKNLTSNPTLWLESLQIPKGSVETRGVLLDKVKELLEKFVVTDYTSAMHKALIVILHYTGMRVSEALSLKFGSIYQLGNYWVVEWVGKRNTKMMAPLTVELLDAIRSLVTWGQKVDLKIDAGSYLFRATPTKRSSSNTAISRFHAYTIYKEAYLAIGVKGVSPHSARVTVATQILANGTPLQEAQKALGHSDPAMTLAYNKIKDVIEKSPLLEIRY